MFVKFVKVARLSLLGMRYIRHILFSGERMNYKLFHI